MSGFATIDYLASYLFLFLLAMALAFATGLRSLRNVPFKQFLRLAVMINPIHFWLDPADIAFKLLVQGLVMCAIFHATPPIRRRLKQCGKQTSALASPVPRVSQRRA